MILGEEFCPECMTKSSTQSFVIKKIVLVFNQ